MRMKPQRGLATVLQHLHHPTIFIEVHNWRWLLIPYLDHGIVYIFTKILIHLVYVVENINISFRGQSRTPATTLPFVRDLYQQSLADKLVDLDHWKKDDVVMLPDRFVRVHRFVLCQNLPLEMSARRGSSHYILNECRHTYGYSMTNCFSIPIRQAVVGNIRRGSVNVCT